jgi:hypothetical protein
MASLIQLNWLGVILARHGSHERQGEADDCEFELIWRDMLGAHDTNATCYSPISTRELVCTAR